MPNDSTAKTRISSDVWEKAGEVADRMGLSTPRQAIEAVFRVYADCYSLGHAPTVPTASPQVVQPTPAPAPPSESVDCVAALDSLLSA